MPIIVTAAPHRSAVVDRKRRPESQRRERRASPLFAGTWISTLLTLVLSLGASIGAAAELSRLGSLMPDERRSADLAAVTEFTLVDGYYLLPTTGMQLSFDREALRFRAVSVR